MKTLLIAGATGLIGRLVVEQALADERVGRVVALTRRLIAPHPKLESVVLDFSALPDAAPWWAVDGVVSALGTTRARTASPSAYRVIDHDYPLAIARRALAHGATRFALVSSLGADPRSPFAYTRLKGELEAGLRTLGFPSLTIVRPSVLDGRREQGRRDERAAARVKRARAPVLPRRLRASPAGAVAAALLEAAVAGPPGVRVKHNEDLRERGGSP